MTFQMWGLLHYLFILSPFLFALIVYFLFKHYKENTLRWIGVGFSLFAIALLIARNIEIYLRVGEINPEMIPFQICHFANFVLLFAFLLRNNTLFTIAFCFNLPAAIVSIVFANSLTNYTTILTWQGMAYIWGHMLIVGLALWAYFNHMFRIDVKTFWKSVLMIAALFMSSIVVNNFFIKWMSPHASNYFYTITPEKGTPLESFYKLGSEITAFGMRFNPIYLLCTLVLGFIVMLLFYGIYKLLNLLRGKTTA